MAASSRHGSSLRGRLHHVVPPRHPAIPSTTVMAGHDGSSDDIDISTHHHPQYHYHPKRQITPLGYAVIAIMLLAEYMTWMRMNGEIVENIVTNTSSKKEKQGMRVNFNITFPALHCEDVHLDVINTAGDTQLDVSTLVKQRLHLEDGTPIKQSSIELSSKRMTMANDAAKESTYELSYDTNDDFDNSSDEYCGPCYGAKNLPDNCCNTCDEVIKAHEERKWIKNGDTEDILNSAEQCIKEGRGKATMQQRSIPSQIKLTKGGEGCNLSGHFTIDQAAAGNFHVAMGTALDRDGKHVHQFIPEDRVNFNTSHVIHELSFGDDVDISREWCNTIISSRSAANNENSMSLNGVSKMVTRDTGTTGLFQYFIKVLPAIYTGDIVQDVIKEEQPTALSSSQSQKRLKINRYFYTERFLPLFGDVGHDDATNTQIQMDDTPPKHNQGMSSPLLRGKTSGTSESTNTELHHQKSVITEQNLYESSYNNILPGVFFVYEIYPFAMEVTKRSVPLVQLCMWMAATVLIVMGLS